MLRAQLLSETKPQNPEIHLASSSLNLKTYTANNATGRSYRYIREGYPRKPSNVEYLCLDDHILVANSLGSIEGQSHI